eukprot:g18196.t1
MLAPVAAAAVPVPVTMPAEVVGWSTGPGENQDVGAHGKEVAECKHQANPMLGVGERATGTDARAEIPDDGIPGIVEEINSILLEELVELPVYPEVKESSFGPCTYVGSPCQEDHNEEAASFLSDADNPSPVDTFGGEGVAGLEDRGGLTSVLLSVIHSTLPLLSAEFRMSLLRHEL